MNDKYEKDGIIYFKTPFEVDYSDWLAKHLDCDSIIKRGNNGSDMISIICYASNSYYNKDLRDLRNTLYPNDKIMHGLSSMEVNCID